MDVLKLYRKIKEGEGNRKSINKAFGKTEDWGRNKKLLDKDHKLYNIWYKRTSKLSRLHGIKVGSRAK